jgi:hypothetical protein
MVHMKLSQAIKPEDHPLGDLTWPSLIPPVALKIINTTSANRYTYYISMCCGQQAFEVLGSDS